MISKLQPKPDLKSLTAKELLKFPHEGCWREIERRVKRLENCESTEDTARLDWLATDCTAGQWEELRGETSPEAFREAIDEARSTPEKPAPAPKPPAPVRTRRHFYLTDDPL